MDKAEEDRVPDDYNLEYDIIYGVYTEYERF